jgi:hypothetical protein
MDGDGQGMGWGPQGREGWREDGVDCWHRDFLRWLINPGPGGDEGRRGLGEEFLQCQSSHNNGTSGIVMLVV